MFTRIRGASLTPPAIPQSSFVADPGLKALYVGSAIASLTRPDGMTPADEIDLPVAFCCQIRNVLTRRPRRILTGQTVRRPLPARLHSLMTPIIAGAADIPAPEKYLLVDAAPLGACS